MPTQKTAPAQPTQTTPKAAVDKAPGSADNQTSQPETVLHTLDNGQLNASKTSSKPTRSMSTTNSKKQRRMFMIMAVVAVIAGVATGYGGFQLQAKTGGGPGLPGASKEPLQQVAGEVINAGDVFGIQDEATFKDSATGYLLIGGLDGEGSHRLLREGGPSQTVYLTSSVTDLDKFEGMQVKVAGETFKAQTAGWLMDVGRVEVLEVEGEAPFEE